jgi:spore coat polysaccharide biosynthesis predicted glycosyltransferase SpsG
VIALTQGGGRKVYEPLEKAGACMFRLPTKSNDRRDAQKVAEIVSQNGVGAIVVDRSHRETLRRPAAFAAYLEKLKAESGPVALIDGLERDSLAFYKKVGVDLAVLPYFGVRPSRYKFAKRTRRLLGPEYFILRKGFSAAKAGKVRLAGRRVLITMGGSDPSGATPILAQELLEETDLQLRLVCGEGFPAARRSELRRLTRNFSSRCSLVNGAESVPKGLRWADIAVTSGGLTKFEAAAAGVPCVMVTHFDREEKAAKAFQAAGSSIHAGRIQKMIKGRVSQVIRDLLDSPSRRRVMARRGRALIDGQGGRRVAAEIQRILKK